MINSESGEIYFLLFMAAIMIMLLIWPKKKRYELDSDAIIRHVVLKNRRSRV